MLPNFIHHLPEGSHFWNTIRLQFVSCALLWDGFQLPIPSTQNATLAGLSGEIVTIQYPGYNGYHMLEPEHYPSNAPGNRTYFVWCGRLLDMLQAFGPNQGGEITIKKLPTDLDGIIEQLLNPNMLSVFHPLMDPIIQLFPVGMHRVYSMEIELDRLVTKDAYVRKEFIIMQAFEPTAWAAILISLLVVGLGSTLILRITTAMHNRAEKLAISLLDWVQDYFDLTYRLGGLLLGEPPNMVSLFGDRFRYKSLYGMWLLLSMLLAAMLSGSMLDLMAAASELYVPEAMQDLCINPDFGEYILFASDVVDLDSDQNPDVKHCLTTLTDIGRFINFPMTSCMTEGIQCIAKLLDLVVRERERLAMVVGERDLYISLFLVDLYSAELAKALSQLHSTTLDAAYAVLDWYSTTVINKAHLADAGRSVSLYYPLVDSVPMAVLKIWKRAAGEFRENGIAYSILHDGDERIKARLVRKEPPPRFQILSPIDLGGCYSLYGAVTLLAIISMIIEPLLPIYQAWQRTRQQPVVAIYLNGLQVHQSQFSARSGQFAEVDI